MSALRRLAVPIGIVSAVLLLLLVQPWFPLEGPIRQVVTVAFWTSFIVLLIALFEERKNPESQEVEVAFQWNTGYNADGIHSFANGINTIEGGTHVEGFKAALTTVVNKHARAKILL